MRGGEDSEAPGGREVAVLGIETSCDECAAAVVRGRRGAARILASTVWSQLDEHALYGGVVPEIAARAHLQTIMPVVTEALRAAELALPDLDAIAATTGPGLQGGLLVGATFAKGLAQARGLQFFAINHLEAHVLTPRLTDGLAFPYLVALLSGGHSQFIAARGVGAYTRLGGTIDDAAGEAFDKVAKMLGLPHPGGPAVERSAQSGDSQRFSLPLPLARRSGSDLSFAGLKTAVRLAAARNAPLGERDIADLCAGFQSQVAAHLQQKAERALAAMMAETAPTALVVAGGVGANQRVRAALQEAATRASVPFVAPPVSLCGDNGAMIAHAAIERMNIAATGAAALGARVRPRWPLDEDAAPLLGGGAKGAKA